VNPVRIPGQNFLCFVATGVLLPRLDALVGAGSGQYGKSFAEPTPGGRQGFRENAGLADHGH
jgi:hypothetical protein